MPKNDPAYMRDYQRRRRSKPSLEIVELPYRDQFGDQVIGAASGTDQGGEHYWLRKLGEDVATCIEFSYQGRLIGGCGMKKAYEGRLLDGGLDLGKVLVDSPFARQIQDKLPITRSQR